MNDAMVAFALPPDEAPLVEPLISDEDTPTWDRVPLLIDLSATGDGLGELDKVLEAAEVIGHNMKFDALWLARKCSRPGSPPTIFVRPSGAKAH